MLTNVTGDTDDDILVLHQYHNVVGSVPASVVCLKARHTIMKQERDHSYFFHLPISASDP